MSPKIRPEKNKERENRVSEENERRRRKKQAMAVLLVFMLTSVSGESSILAMLAVTLFKNPALIYIFPTLVPNKNLI